MHLRLINNLLFRVMTLTLISTNAYADCAITGATPEGGNIVLCTAADPNGWSGSTKNDDVTISSAAVVSGKISTGHGDDSILNQGGIIDVSRTRNTAGVLSSAAIDSGNGDDDVTLNLGEVASNSSHASTGIATATTIQTGNGNDIVTINGSQVAARASGAQAVDAVGIDSGGGDDQVFFNDATLNVVAKSETTGSGIPTGIQTSWGDDLIVLNGGSIIIENASGLATMRSAVAAGGGRDVVIIAKDTLVTGLILGGNGPEPDTLRFSLDIPEAERLAFRSAISVADSADGQIEINGKVYRWKEFEKLEFADEFCFPIMSQTSDIAVICL